MFRIYLNICLKKDEQRELALPLIKGVRLFLNMLDAEICVGAADGGEIMLRCHQRCRNFAWMMVTYFRMSQMDGWINMSKMTISYKNYKSITTAKRLNDCLWWSQLI